MEQRLKKAIGTSRARVVEAAEDGHKILTELREFFRHHGQPYPSSMFDDTRTWAQTLEAYFKKVGGVS